MDIIKICVDTLRIRRPFRIELRSGANKKVDALYWPTYSDKKGNLTHMIRVYLGNGNRPLESLIAHEFIHAWQEENKINEIHGPEFQNMARVLSRITGLQYIYIEGTDD